MLATRVDDRGSSHEDASDINPPVVAPVLTPVHQSTLSEPVATVPPSSSSKLSRKLRTMLWHVYTIALEFCTGLQKKCQQDT